MRSIIFTVSAAAVMLFSSCGDSIYTAHSYLTGPVDGVGLKKTTSIVSGETEQLYPVVTPSKTDNKNVSWTSSDETVASVDSSGIVTAVASVNEGETKSAVITVTTEEGSFNASCTVTVVEKPIPVTSLTLSRVTSSLVVNTPGIEHLTAEISPSNATNQQLTWSSSAPDTVSVDASGLVTAKQPGTGVITVTAASGVKATCVYTILSEPVSVTGITLNKVSTVIETGSSERLFASFTPVNATNRNLTWTSTNSDIASVDSTGLVTGKSTGTATIKVTSIDGGHTASCVCTVTASAVKATGVSLNTTALIITAGYTEQLSAVIKPVDASGESIATNQGITWKSSDINVASVDSSGQVIGINSGSTTITATTSDGGFVASCTCMVSSAIIYVSSVTLNKSTLTLGLGQTETLFTQIAPAFASNRSVTWSSSNTSVATVNGSGTVTAKSTGTATITATTTDGGKTSSCICTVSSSYRVIYRNNGSSGEVPDPGYYTYGEEVTVSGNTGGLVKTGYFLSGWNTQSNGSGSQYAPGSTFTMGNADVILYAMWKRPGVIYIASDKTGGAVPVDNNSYTPGDKAAVKISYSATAGNLYKIEAGTGYRCSGWTDGTNTYNEGDELTIGSSDTILTAVWTAFAIGDKGPAGGWIFYIADTYQVDATNGNWRYMEAAPLGWEAGETTDPEYQYLSENGSYIYGMYYGIGYGLHNTNLLISNFSGSVTPPAALACKNCSAGGKTDWFLPSKDELYELWTYNNSHSQQFGMEKYAGNRIYYWTSSAQIDNGQASSNAKYPIGWQSALSNGQIRYDDDDTAGPSNNSKRVRPVRRF